MGKMSLNELRWEIAEILAEAKKKKEKAEKAKKKAGTAAMAYGIYDEELDFSAPLGDSNLYKQQGGVNWGPQTSGGPVVDSAFHGDPANGKQKIREMDEAALRMLVREVMQTGLVPADSAWAPLMESTSNPNFDTIWEAALHYYDVNHYGLGRANEEKIACKKEEDAKKAARKAKTAEKRNK